MVLLLVIQFFWLKQAPKNLSNCLNLLYNSISYHITFLENFLKQIKLIRLRNETPVNLILSKVENRFQIELNFLIRETYN